MLIIFILLQLLSIAFTIALLWKFRYHLRKRLDFMRALESPSIGWSITQWQILSGIYILLSLGILVATTLVFFALT
ncbi:MAG: hypothetical protein WCX61_03855 [Candidatus Peribacteraceae bacterium]|jgi:hypothetical protein